MHDADYLHLLATAFERWQATPFAGPVVRAFGDAVRPMRPPLPVATATLLSRATVTGRSANASEHSGCRRCWYRRVAIWRLFLQVQDFWLFHITCTRIVFTRP
jgi:hypothetical protein